jgi:hypothetical protein
MIDRYTIKFGPAVSQKELEQKLHALKHYDPSELDGLRKMKARIEIVCDFGDLRAIREFLEQREKTPQESTNPSE